MSNELERLEELEQEMKDDDNVLDYVRDDEFASASYGAVFPKSETEQTEGIAMFGVNLDTGDVLIGLHAEGGEEVSAVLRYCELESLGQVLGEAVCLRREGHLPKEDQDGGT